MTKVEVVARASEEEKHQIDTEGLCVYGDRVFTCADDGKVKVRRLLLDILFHFGCCRVTLLLPIFCLFDLLCSLQYKLNTLPVCFILVLYTLSRWVTFTWYIS